MPINDVARSFRPTFKRAWFADGYCWGKLSEANKRFYFEEFKKKFRWEGIDNSIMYDAFCERAAGRYAQAIYDIRYKGKMRHLVDDDVYKVWEEKWNEESFKKLCEIKSQNRRSEHIPGGGISTHSCGSRSIFDHKEAMKRKNGDIEPLAFELFKQTHTTKNEHGEIIYVCQKAQKVADNYVEECNSTQKDGDAAQVDPNQIFFKVVDGKSIKQRVYGVGESASLYFPDSFRSTCTSRHRASGYDQHTYETMRSHLREDFMKEMEEEVDRRVESRLQSSVQTIVQQQMTQLLQNGPPPGWFG